MLADKDRVYGYLVTAKHVLTKSERGPWLQKVFLRLDKSEGGTETVEIPLVSEGSKKTVFTSSDIVIDLAVIPFLPDQKTIDFKVLPVNLVTSREDFPKLKISEGSEIFFTGLFTPHVARKERTSCKQGGRGNKVIS